MTIPNGTDLATADEWQSKVEQEKLKRWNSGASLVKLFHNSSDSQAGGYPRRTVKYAMKHA